MNAPTEQSTSFNPAALKDKYRHERDKRLRPDGILQYRLIDERLQAFVADPYTPVSARPARYDDVQVLIVGGGFSGLMTAAKLKQAGINQVCIVERGGDFGGTWYWNRYPGAQCDVESYIYLPLLEELGYMPKEKYSYAREIFAHCQALGRHYQLYDDACFHTLVTELRWDTATLNWQVTTNRGDTLSAQFICLADGPLSQPKLPGIAGLERFQGKMFHTSRWDYEYTGGFSDERLVKLVDKRVAVIGTGATGIQCVPVLADYAQQLYVMQRTPSSVFARDNCDTDKAWAKSLMPGWQQARMNNFNRVSMGINDEPDQVDDGLSRIMRQLGHLPKGQSNTELSPEALAQQVELRDFAVMEELRKRVDSLVNDAKTAELLKPWYKVFCKRPCFNDAYLQAFNRPNVQLVDTDGKGVTGLTETAVIVGSQSYEVDCLIFATGFEIGTAYPKRAGFELYGDNGLSLSEKWAEGMRTLYGMQTQGFPNCFFVGMTQGAYTANYTHMLYEQSEHIAYIVAEVVKRGQRAVDVTEQGEAAWVAEITRLAQSYSTFYQDCTPGYYNNEGKPNEGNNAKIASFYGGGSEAFFELLHAWRQQGDLQGLVFLD